MWTIVVYQFLCLCESFARRFLITNVGQCNVYLCMCRWPYCTLNFVHCSSEMIIKLKNKGKEIDKRPLEYCNAFCWSSEMASCWFLFWYRWLSCFVFFYYLLFSAFLHSCMALFSNFETVNFPHPPWIMLCVILMVDSSHFFVYKYWL